MDEEMKEVIEEAGDIVVGEVESFYAECAEYLKKSLIDFGFTKGRAEELANSNFMRKNVDIPFPGGRLVINAGSVRRLVKKSR